MPRITRRHLHLSLRWLAAAALAALVAVYALYTLKVRSGVTHATRGEQVAHKMGCFACHGLGGEAGIPNLGSEEKTVPSWTGGTAMRYILKPEELDEWVLDGHPKRLANHDHEDQTLHMPAYRGRISKRDYADLREYLKAVMGLDAPAEGDAKAGYEIAQQSGCFGCHGPAGRGLRSNTGSLAGYIPGWEGGPYADMVTNDAELEEWIRTGTSKRMQQNRIAAYFMKRQIITMPAYDKRLSKEEIDKLIAYIRWLRNPAPTS